MTVKVRGVMGDKEGDEGEKGLEKCVEGVNGGKGKSVSVR